ncbi:MAG: hypothetical protein J0M24_18085 [Verrucomicrobia bacterium]|nr:hypothetical protein [Verrucomicrobiota bacterium]
MRISIIAFAAAAQALVSAISAPAPIYINEGVNPNPVVIDATIFLNTGTFTIGAPNGGFFNDFLSPVNPYETQNTLYYTNTFRMSAVPGFNLEFISDSGVRRPAAQVYNAPGATISAEFSDLAANLFFPNTIFPLYGGLVSINATNVINKGTIEGFYAGSIEIRGDNVDLSASRVGSTPLDFSTFRTWRYIPDASRYQPSIGLVDETYFSPETNVRDIWWRYGFSALDPLTFAVEQVDDFGFTNLVVDTGGFYIYTFLTDDQSPENTDPPFASLTLRNPAVFMWTNQPSATNKQIEVVFVDNPDTNVLVDVSWANGPSRDFPAKTAFIRFTSVQPDLINQGASTAVTQFVIADTFGSAPLTQLLINGLTLNSQAPTNIFAFRAYPDRYNPARPIGPITTNATFSPSVFNTWFDAAFVDGFEMTNVVTTNLYATYSGELARFPSQNLNDITFIPITDITSGTIFDLIAPTPVPGASITNIAGRVAIDAKTLDLRRAQIQGQGTVSIRADNLKSSRGAVIDAPILNYDLGSTNGVLEIRDLAKSSVSRFGGTFAVFSTTFTNSFDYVTNTPGTTNETGEVEPGEEVTTNFVAIYHVTVVRNFLDTAQQTLLNDLILRSKAVSIQDEMLVDGQFRTTAESLNLQGALALTGITNLTAANLPSLKNFSNSGTLTVPSFIALGTSPGVPLETIENSGVILSTASSFNSKEFLLSGTILAEGGNIVINTTDFLSDGGTLSAANDVVITAINADLSGIATFAGGRVTLNVTGSVSDGGLDLPGVITAPYGFSLPIKPATGDLLGTTLTLESPAFAEATSYWAGEDRGPSRVGYTNNVALAALILNAGAGGVVGIAPIGEKNAMYVETLDLSDEILVDLENSLILVEGMTLYYATTSPNVDPASLDGFVTAGGGTLRWVQDGSSPTVIMVEVSSGDGRVLRVPRSLRFSTVLDSDADGVANADDASPFDLVVVSQVSLVDDANPAFEVQWNAAAGQTYEVQATQNLASGVWVPVKVVTNSSTSTQRVIVRDPVDPGTPLKAYRVVVKP